MRSSDWLRTKRSSDWLRTNRSSDWLRTKRSSALFNTKRSSDWLRTKRSSDWLRTKRSSDWLRTKRSSDWLRTEYMFAQTKNRKLGTGPYHSTKISILYYRHNSQKAQCICSPQYPSLPESELWDLSCPWSPGGGTRCSPQYPTPLSTCIWTVRSILPLIPRRGDQMFSSMSTTRSIRPRHCGRSWPAEYQTIKESALTEGKKLTRKKKGQQFSFIK